MNKNIKLVRIESIKAFDTQIEDYINVINLTIDNNGNQETIKVDFKDGGLDEALIILGQTIREMK